MKTWFKVKAKAEGSKAVEVSIFDDIGAYGVSAKDFMDEIKGFKGQDIELSINSYGGEVFHALAMYNALRGMGSNIHVKVLGVAASSASLVAMAGDTITMPENTFLMVHNPWGYFMGNADELRDSADVLETIASAFVKTYASRTGMSEDEVKDLMAAETWLTAEEAVAKGFATAVEPAMKIAAMADEHRLPGNVLAAIKAHAEPQPEGDNDATDEDPASGEPAGEEPEAHAALADEIAAYAQSVGLSDYAALVALDAGVTDMVVAKERFAAAKEISALCAVAGVKDMADSLIRDGVSLDSARARITDALASQADKLKTSNARAGEPQANAAGANVWSKIFPSTAAHKE